MIRTVQSRRVYENDYVRVYDDEVEFPSGRRGTYYYQRWKSPHGVAILPVAGDRVLLVNNYRYADRCYSLEIPQGFGGAQETPLDSARRELTEETGLTTDCFRLLFHTGHDYRTHVFAADLESFDGLTPKRAEETEDIAGFRILSCGEISIGSLSAAGIFDAVTIAALLALRDLRQP